MMGSMFPSASEPTGFVGMMSRIVSAMDISSCVATWVSLTAMALMSTPRPGLMTLATPRATHTATAVVHR